MDKNKKTKSTINLNTDGMRILARVIARNLRGSYPYDEEHLVESGENHNEAGYSVTNLPNDEYQS